MKCKYCGGERFIGHQRVNMDVVVDGGGSFVDDLHPYDPGLDIYNSNTPYGPFQCMGCGAEYDELADGQEPISGPEEGWTQQEDTNYTRDQLLDVLESYARMIERNRATYPTVLIDDLDKSIQHVLKQNGRRKATENKTPIAELADRFDQFAETLLQSDLNQIEEMEARIEEVKEKLAIGNLDTYHEFLDTVIAEAYDETVVAEAKKLRGQQNREEKQYGKENVDGSYDRAGEETLCNGDW